jgi:starch synthase
MCGPNAQPRILFVSSELVFIPEGNGGGPNFICPRTGGFGDLLANLISDLSDLGADVYVAQPDYRKIFSALYHSKRLAASKKIPGDRVCLTRDRVFFYANRLHETIQEENSKISIAFQREVINHVIMEVQPDLLHCHDWMTGLIPAIAKIYRIPCLFTFQNPNTAKALLTHIEDIGIDAAEFWQYLFYDRYPISYEETRGTNSVDFLLSGILSADFVNASSSAFLSNMAQNQNAFAKLQLWELLVTKMSAGCAAISSNISKVQQHIAIYQKMLQRSLFQPKRKYASIKAVAS